MFQLIKNIKIVMILLLVSSCSLIQVENSEEIKMDNSNVTVSIPRLNPLVGEGLKKSNDSRAYFTADKLVLKAYNSSNVLVDTFTYDVDSESIGQHMDGILEVSLILSIGNYTLEADVFNFSNSTTTPVVSGISDPFTVSNDIPADIFISMTPNNSVAITRGDINSITNPQYTGLGEYDNIYNVGSDYWFKYKANSDFSVISILNNSVNYPEDSLPSLVSRVFDSSGFGVSGATDIDGNYIFETLSGEEYFILIVPVKHYKSGQSYFSDEITFSVDSYVDQNVSEATSEVLGKAYLKNGLFSGLSDFDYYKVNLTAGSTYIFESTFSVLSQVTDLTGVIVGEVLETDYNDRVHFTVDTSGDYYLRIDRSSFSNFSIESYDFIFQELSFVSTNTPSDSWIDGDMNNCGKQFYKVLVDPTKEYSIKLDNLFDGTGQYTSKAGIGTYTFSKDPVTGVVNYKNNYISFDAYSNPQVINLLPGSTELIIEISDFRIEGGTFAFQIQEYIPPTP